MNTRPRALVLEASLNASLAVVRSLGRLGWDITTGDHYGVSPALLSRYTHKRLRYPDPEEDRKVFLDFLEEHLSKEHYDLIFPISDFTVIPIAQNRKRFEQYAGLAIAPTEQLMIAVDKARTIEVAQASNVGCPATIMPNCIGEIQDIAQQLQYPSIVKARSKVSWVGEKPFVHKVTKRNYVNNPEELTKVYQDIHRVSPLPIIQELIRGEAFGFFAFMIKGEPKAVFGHRRLREYPLSGGASTCRESYMDSDLETEGLKILRALNWDGVAMVEFKKDVKDGKYKIMEINGRWWGSLPLALVAGVDFPHYYSRYLMDETIDNVPETFPLGVCCRALLPWDLLWLGARLRQPGRLNALREFFSPRGLHFDIWTLRDPLPALGSIILMFFYLGKVMSGKLTIEGEKR